ncbi:MAG: hypothetical protein ACLP00_28715 [Terracidiphilus sp.]
MTSSYATDFHDITSGTSGSYSAEVGYDLVTGWGTPNGAGLISALTPAATSPTFSLSVSPASLSVARKSSDTLTVITKRSGSFDSAITLSASGQDSGEAVTFTPGSVVAPSSEGATLTVKASNKASTGNHTVTIGATGGGITQTITITVDIIH